MTFPPSPRYFLAANGLFVLGLGVGMAVQSRYQPAYVLALAPTILGVLMIALSRRRPLEP